MGLLNPDSNSYSFWPSSFDEKSDLKLKSGAYLEEEKLIDFDL